jgi:hypothetical protein
LNTMQMLQFVRRGGQRSRLNHLDEVLGYPSVSV